MIDSDESGSQGDREKRPAYGGWLLLLHEVPPKPDYLRVKIRRRLQRLGAVALKNAVYALPRRTETLEDFQWLRREIVSAGGEATILAADLLAGLTDAELEDQFRNERDGEYAALVRSAREAGPRPGPADLGRLRRQMEQIRGRDHLGAPGRALAEAALAELDALAGAEAQATITTERAGSARAPRGTTWVTREGVHIDRIASAWLIRRFIDPEARFRFVPGKGYRPEAGELRFDMFEGEFTHEGDRCTFETLLIRFDLTRDEALVAVGEIVHDIDCKDGKFGRRETDGVATVIQGIVLAHADDPARIEAGATVFEGLYARFGQPA